ncbi:MAG: DUF3805 domain-containing protein [Mucilaginibacter sp.]|nr:DUF3805 domain-containing protein [Mucilaginibacter sp.]
MNYWKFTSSDDWFSTKLPENWAEYDDEIGTAAFFNTKQWSGNLRITPVRLAETDIDKTPVTVSLYDNQNALVVKLGDWVAEFFSEPSSDDCIIYYWTIGSKSMWFMCSFTIDKKFFNTETNEKELAVVEGIISKIEILR